MMSETVLKTHVSKQVATVTLARPQVRNALNEALVEHLQAMFDDLGKNDAVRVIVLAAEGPVFCAGADLAWMQQVSRYTYEQNVASARALAQMLHAIDTCPKPVVARVQGDAWAGGLGLIAASDIAVAADSATFCLSEVKLGLVPATIAPYIVRAMGVRQIRRYALTAESFDAIEAQRIGLIHVCVAPDALDAQIQTMTDALVQVSAQAIMHTKQVLREVAGQTIDAQLIESTARHIAQARASKEGQEGLTAFLDKRRPRW